jgi:hypothetical protein
LPENNDFTVLFWSASSGRPCIPAKNVKLHEKQYGGSDGAFITYAVQCECNRPVDFDYAALLRPQIKQEIKEEVTDLSA